MKVVRTHVERNALAMGLGITTFITLMRLINVGEGLSLRSLDFLFWLRGPIEPKANVCIVAIDNESFNEMPERWTWPRSFHARLIRQIARGKPKVIVFDMLFGEETSSDPKQDAELAAACRSAGCVVLGAELVNVMDQRFRYQELKLPIKVLRSAIYSAGVVNTPKDNDAFVRRAALVWKVNEERYFSLSLEALRKYLGVGKGEINIEGDKLEFGDRTIPIDGEGKMLINYRGPAKTFKTIPYYQVYKGMVDPGVFRDAIVFIGATAEVLHDTFPTPFTWKPFLDEETAQPVPGVEIHANTIDTILSGNHIKDTSLLMTSIVVFGLGALISWVSIRAMIWVSLTLALGTAFGITALSGYLFFFRNEFFEIIHPLYSIGGAFLGVTTYRAAIERRERQRIRGTFARYLSPHVLSAILSAPPELGGARRVATILFSDIRGFTSISEKMDPHEIVGRLNEYLSAMVDVVLKHDGTLDKFVGDAVMAVFGSPMDQPDHALRAVSTAWHMSKRLDELQQKWIAENKVVFNIGIGINTGEVVAGNMGSPDRMEFTVIGDNVNTASRLESLTKEVGCRILMSESTYLVVKDRVEVREHPPLRVKGKEKPVKIFELVDFKGEPPMFAALLKKAGL